MKIRTEIIAALLALVATIALQFMPLNAHAQAPTPRIDGFDVNQVARVTPGTELLFTLYGTPGGTAAVQVAGATGGVNLNEVEPGVYEGIYTIRSRDKLTSRSTATANLRVGTRVVSVLLDESLVGSARTRPPVTTSNRFPKIDTFSIDPPASLAVGSDLIFTLTGTPNAVANARIAGVRGRVNLDEIRPGVYEGVYIIKNRDSIAPNAAVTATLRVGEQRNTRVLNRSLVAAAGNPLTSRRSSQVCQTCGVVEAVNVVEVKGEGSYLGGILGGVGGAILGSQIGSGRGTTAAQVAGAVGGAIAGNAIEKRMKTTKHYEVVVRLDNGGAQTIAYPAEPGFKVGTRVKVENGTLVQG